MLLVLAGALLLLGAALALGLRSNHARAGAALVTQTLASALVLWAVVPVLAGAPEVRVELSWSYPIETLPLHLDALSAFFLSWSLPLTLVGTVYAVGYLRHGWEARHAGVQFALLNVVSLSFLLVYVVENAFVFLLGWEIAALAAWLLVIWDYRNQKIRFAGFNYLVSTHVGLVFLLAAFMVMYSQAGAADFQAFGRFLHLPSTMRDTTFVLLVVAFGLKAAFFPFHTWLPRAHAAAPAHVSALMSGVIHKAGLFGLLRFLLLMGRPEEWMGWSLVAFGGLSAIAGALYSTTQRDLKRLLGYSSTENVGLVAMGAGLGSLGLSWNQPTLVVLGFAGGVLHLFNHALFKCLLFYAAGAVYRATHTIDLERLGGLFKKLPWTGSLFLIGGVAIAGLPPLNGFASEYLLYSGFLDASAPAGFSRALLVLAAAGLAFVGGVSALAVARAFGITFLGVARDPQVHVGGEVNGWMRWPMVVHAVLLTAVGLFPPAGLWLVREVTRSYLLNLPQASMARLDELPGRLLPLVTIAALLLLSVAALWFVRRRLCPPALVDRHVTWGCGYTAPTPRMQYTGASFADAFASWFQVLLVFVRREKLPHGPFPQGNGSLVTHGIDAVERRIFEALGEGEDQVRRVGARLPEASGFSFGLGLLTLVVMVGALVAAVGGTR